MCKQKNPTGQPSWMFAPVSGSCSSASAALQLPGGDTELRILQRAPQDAGFALQEEGRVNRGVTNPQQVHTWLPSATTLAEPNSFALSELQTHSNPSLPLLWPWDGSSSGKCWVTSPQSQLQTPSQTLRVCPDQHTKAVRAGM